jgi:UDP-N-acetylmuramoylalanine-D-glutamate ligase
VAEISSFQLDTAKSFRPGGLAAQYLPDHLDRYDDFQAYIASKEPFPQPAGGDAPY